MTSLLRPLGDTAEFINGLAFKPEDWGNEGRRIIRIQNLNDPSKTYNWTTKRVSSRFLVDPGDILVSWSASLGVFTWQGPDIAVLNQHIFKVVPNEKVIWKPYLRHVLVNALNDMLQHLHGATMQHVNRGAFLNTPVYVPPLDEQQRIAAILDKAEALREKRILSINKLDMLPDRLYEELFGDPFSNPRDWCVLPVSSFLERTPNYGSMSPPSVDKGEWLSLRVANIQDWRLQLQDSKFIDIEPGQLDRHTVQDGDLLLARAIASLDHLGKCVVVYPGDRKWGFDSHLMRLRFDQSKVLPEYIMRTLMTPGGRRLFLAVTRKSTVQFNVNTGEMLRLKLPIPPLDQQMQFRSVLAKVEREREIAFRQLKGIENMISSLAHQYFS